MEFLVNMEVNWPADGDPELRARLFADEQVRGQELARAGMMRRLWRVPGRWANWGLWEAPDATALHAAISSLPLWPWMSVTVIPLAQHQNDPKRLGIAAAAEAADDTQAASPSRSAPATG